jgi:hypothetical protein
MGMQEFGKFVKHGFLHLRQGFDIQKEPVLHDILLVCGFIQSLGLALRIKQRGLAWMALPCQSFTFMSSSGHQRSFWTPYGNLHMPFVHTGNCICARTCLVILVAIARSASFFVENPGNSALNCWPFINFLMSMPWLNTHRTSWLLADTFRCVFCALFSLKCA